MAQKVDGQFLRSLLNFINREKPTLPIDSAISLLTKCIYDSAKIETQIDLLKDAGITTMINKIKENKVQKIPTTLWESFMTGNLFKYLKIKISNEWIGSDKTNVNLQKVDPFH